MSQPDALRFNLSGIEVITSLYLTDPETRTIARTWKERLFSRPWRPLMATKKVTVQVPSSRVLMMNGKAIMHPQALKAFREISR